MELTLSHNNPLNTILSDSEGKPLYYITTPGTWTRKTTTICRVSSRASEAYRDFQLSTQHGRGKLKRLPREWDLGLREAARIHWHILGSSRLVYQGRIEDFRSFMPSSGFILKTRTFTSPDGQSYRWKMGWLTCELELNDGSVPPKVIARFRQQNVLDGTKPSLEIYPEGMHISELIMITWVFVETRRRDMERKYIST